MATEIVEQVEPLTAATTTTAVTTTTTTSISNDNYKK